MIVMMRMRMTNSPCVGTILHSPGGSLHGDNQSNQSRVFIVLLHSSYQNTLLKVFLWRMTTRKDTKVVTTRELFFSFILTISSSFFYPVSPLGNLPSRPQSIFPSADKEEKMGKKIPTQPLFSTTEGHRRIHRHTPYLMLAPKMSPRGVRMSCSQQGGDATGQVRSTLCTQHDENQHHLPIFYA